MSNPSGYNVLTGQFADASQGPAGHLAPGNRLQPAIAGSGLFSTAGSNGQVLHARRQNAIASRSKFPFQIIKGPAAEDGTPQLGVFFLSSILKPSLDPTDNVAIAGLLASITPALTDPGWFPIPAIGGKIWLQIGTADPGDDTHTLQPWAATTQIQHADDVTTIWDEYPAIAINTDDPENPYQEFFNLLLAEITDPEADDRPALFSATAGDERRQVTQMYDRNVLLTTWAVDGIAMLVPVDPTLLWLATA